jgi:hypothetical protein
MMEKDYAGRLLALTTPCSNCPFRKVGAISLMPGRLVDIVKDLLTDDLSTFHCHKTLDWSGEDSAYKITGSESVCAGSMIYLEKIRQPNVVMRIGYALGKLDQAVLKDQADIIIDEVKYEGL